MGSSRGDWSAYYYLPARLVMVAIFWLNLVLIAIAHRRTTPFPPGLAALFDYAPGSPLGLRI